MNGGLFGKYQIVVYILRFILLIYMYFRSAVRNASLHLNYNVVKSYDDDVEESDDDFADDEHESISLQRRQSPKGWESEMLMLKLQVYFTILLSKTDHTDYETFTLKTNYTEFSERLKPTITTKAEHSKISSAFRIFCSYSRLW